VGLSPRTVLRKSFMVTRVKASARIKIPVKYLPGHGQPGYGDRSEKCQTRRWPARSACQRTHETRIDRSLCAWTSDAPTS
jgi:hypothetical protein